MFAASVATRILDTNSNLFKSVDTAAICRMLESIPKFDSFILSISENLKNMVPAGISETLMITQTFLNESYLKDVLYPTMVRIAEINRMLSFYSALEINAFLNHLSPSTDDKLFVQSYIDTSDLIVSLEEDRKLSKSENRERNPKIDIFLKWVALHAFQIKIGVFAITLFIALKDSSFVNASLLCVEFLILLAENENKN